MDLKCLIICLKEVKKLGNSEEVLLLDHMQEAAISKCPPSLVALCDGRNQFSSKRENFPFLWKNLKNLAFMITLSMAMKYLDKILQFTLSLVNCTETNRYELRLADRGFFSYLLRDQLAIELMDCNEKFVISILESVFH